MEEAFVDEIVWYGEVDWGDDLEEFSVEITGIHRSKEGAAKKALEWIHKEILDANGGHDDIVRRLVEGYDVQLTVPMEIKRRTGGKDMTVCVSSRKLLP